MSKHLDQIVKETQSYIVKLSQGFKRTIEEGEFLEGNPYPVQTYGFISGSQAYALHTSLLQQDYITMTGRKISDKNDELWKLIDTHPGPSVNYLDCITIGDFLQLVTCIGDITALATISGTKRYSVINYSTFAKATGNAARTLEHFLTKADVEHLKTPENAAILTNVIMHSALSDIADAIVLYMSDIISELSGDLNKSRFKMLESLAAACGRYLRQIGCSFDSNSWDDSKFGQKKEILNIVDWHDWGTRENGGRLYGRPIYMSWYNPLDGEVYEAKIVKPC